MVVPPRHRRDADLTIERWFFDRSKKCALLRNIFAKLTLAAEVDRAAPSYPPRMITAILVYEHPQALSIVEALQPDNTPEIKMKATGNRVEITVQTKKLRTLVASCDDLLSNLQIAQEMLSGF